MMKTPLTAILAFAAYLFPIQAQPQPTKPVSLHSLKKELPSLGEQGIFQRYNIHRIGSVTFPDCQFHNGEGLDAISRKLQSYDLRDKIIVLYGSADTRSAKNCPSVTNDYLSGHRAVSTLNDLEAKMGDHLHAAHVDIIAGGNTLNRRAVDIYLLDKRKMEITDPF